MTSFRLFSLFLSFLYFFTVYCPCKYRLDWDILEKMEPPRVTRSTTVRSASHNSLRSRKPHPSIPVTHKPTTTSATIVSSHSSELYVGIIPSIFRNSDFGQTNPPFAISTAPATSSAGAVDFSGNDGLSVEVLGCVFGPLIILGLAMALVLCMRKRDKRGTAVNDVPAHYHQQPPPAYSLDQPSTTPREIKRLTAETLVERASVSTLVSKKQYTPQLAYTPDEQDSVLLGVSPSNTLVGTDYLSEKRASTDQMISIPGRIPSYQPQISVHEDSQQNSENWYHLCKNGSSAQNKTE